MKHNEITTVRELERYLENRNKRFSKYLNMRKIKYVLYGSVPVLDVYHLLYLDTDDIKKELKMFLNDD